MKWSRIKTVAIKEVLEIWRDKLYLSMAFLIPVLMMIVLGFGMSMDVEKIPFVAVDYDNSEQSRDYLHRYIDSRYFDYKGMKAHESQAEPLMIQNKIRFILVIPPGFQEKLLAGKRVQVQPVIDGLFTYQSKVVRGYVSSINADFNQQLMRQWLKKKRGMNDNDIEALLAPVTLETRYLFNEKLSSLWSTGSGMIMLVMLMAPAVLTALGVVREKESGSIFNIYASTVSRSEFIIGKILPYVVISFVNLLVLSWMALVMFGVPFKGDPVLYLVASLLYVACSTGIGMLVSILVKTQAAAALITMLGTMIPGMMMSGLMIPVNSMEAGAKMEAHLLPAMYQLNIVWGSFLKGQGWPELGTNVLILALHACVLWGISIWRFRKRVKA
ncbi:ABC transporter permease [Thiomicrorhabdus sp. ZW0627]|uniref:ABC transporter permease n=1 Tax=Thiomicrorhabdus sp. ZW0627 TaxID=3039774 RepID=UPI0024367954|nr:ABC transporter permease [Thiomicrorhabdus sp. ZW0627]MDG6773022.1 ABC transporter permease [Thiomicrorhabdus sp. ZW0627]